MMNGSEFSSEIIETCIPPVCKVPLKVGDREFSQVLIKKGAKVKEGQPLASTKESPQHYLHAPIPGKIQSLEEVECPGGGSTQAVVIHLSGNFDWQRSKLVESTWRQKRKEELFQKIHTCGATIFLPRNLPPPDTVRQIVITSCSYEPSLMVDRILLQKYTDQVIQGAEVLAQIYGTQEVVFGVTRDPLLSLEKKLKSRKLPWKVVYIHQSSPVYFLNDEILIRKVYAEDSSIQNPQVFPIHFVHAVYETIILSRPVMERIVAVGGLAIGTPRFVKIRLGAPVATLFQECGGWRERPQKIVVGGLLTGKTIVDLETPVSGNMQALFALTKKEIFVEKQIPCIQCGSCVQACPVYLHPLLLYKLVKKQKREEAEQSGLSYCVECGLCAQVCPSRLPLSSIITRAKKDSSHVIT